MIDTIQTIRLAMVAASSLSSLTTINWGEVPEGTAYPFAQLNAVGNDPQYAFKNNDGTLNEATDEYIQVALYSIDDNVLLTLQNAMDTVLNGAILTLSGGTQSVSVIREGKFAGQDGEDKNKNKVYKVGGIYHCQLDRTN